VFKSILLPIDGSEYSATATKYAIQAAEHYKASITALYVIDVKKLAAPLLNDVALCLGITAVPNLEETYRSTLFSIGETALEVCSRKCRMADVPCTTKLKTGIVADAICQEAHAVDLVVMGHRGEASEWGSRIFGSVFEATIRQINRPVFIVGKYRQQISRILVAYDGSNHANNVLRIAADLCSTENIPMHVLVAGLPDEDERELQDEIVSYMRNQTVDWTFERADGDPAEAIIVRANELNADVIAMGAYGHSRIKELLVGSTTEYVLRNASCPVLVFR